MIRFIQTENELAKMLELRNKIIFDNTIPSANIFRADYQTFLFFDEGIMMNPEFLNMILPFSKQMGIEEILYITIEPSPLEYYSECHKYGAFIFSISSTYEEIRDFMMYTEPDGATGCPMVYTSNQSTLIPICDGIPDWCVYRLRGNGEIGIIAFKNKDLANQFLKFKTKDKMIVDANINIAFELISLAWGGRMPEDYKKKFFKNYNK
jgi:hypothetical protein